MRNIVEDLTGPVRDVIKREEAYQSDPHTRQPMRMGPSDLWPPKQTPHLRDGLF